MSGSLYSYECRFVIIPGDTPLFDAGLTWLPQKGMVVENYDHDTDITTQYRVQEVFLLVLPEISRRC